MAFRLDSLLIGLNFKDSTFLFESSQFKILLILFQQLLFIFRRFKKKVFKHLIKILEYFYYICCAKKANISSSKLNLKIQNIWIKQMLEP
jgi:hypothetical protein